MAGRSRKNRTKRRKSAFLRVIGLLLIALVAAYALWSSGKLDFGFLSGGSGSQWNLTLVNAEHAVPDDWETELTELKNGQRVDSRMYPYLQEMFDACREDGLLPIVKSSYRTAEEQREMLDEKVSEYEAAGCSADEAEKLAETAAAQPGHSEHQLGLAVDIDSEDVSACSNEAVWAWMDAHCAEYGFILRYPDGKEDVTGYQYEPWHFRYVGKEAAEAIMSNGITLEEYLENK